MIGQLTSGRSPEAIWAHHLVAEDIAGRVCVETVYAALYAGTLVVKPTACLRTRRTRRQSRQVRHTNQRPALPNIAGRSDTVNDRNEPGHWEADHLIGTANGSALMCPTDRVSRYSTRIIMPDGYSAPAVHAELVEGLEKVPSIYAGRSPLTKAPNGADGRNWSPPTVWTTGSVICTRPGSGLGREAQPPVALVVSPRHRGACRTFGVDGPTTPEQLPGYYPLPMRWALPRPTPCSVPHRGW